MHYIEVKKCYTTEKDRLYSPTSSASSNNDHIPKTAFLNEIYFVKYCIFFLQQKCNSTGFTVPLKFPFSNLLSFHVKYACSL